jgi:hypothetical protein
MKNYNIVNYFFGENFKLYFLMKNNYIILEKKSRFFFLKLPYIYFYKYRKKNERIFSFIFFKFFHYISFFKHVLQLYNKLSSFYFLKLKLKGLGYRIIHISKFLIKFFFNRNNFFYLHLPKTILFRYKIRRLFFLSTRLMDLRNLMINLLLLKKYLVYRLSGLFYPRQIILLKPGKNKFR